MSRAELRANYPWLFEMPTRWKDNDRYGHMNNAVYYSVFENTVMTWIEVKHGLDPNTGNVRCFTAENGCCFHAPVRYPDMLECGLRVARLGNSSVRYELGIFIKDREPVAATGFIVDVFVDVMSEKPITIPDAFREALAPLHVTPAE
jgi:acyl-CoA thioester hydrolase